MGFNKHKRKVRDAIESWKCQGSFGYGEGRASVEFDKATLQGRSVCFELCAKRDECRQAHFAKMDKRFPITAQLVKLTVAEARRENMPLVDSVVKVMNLSLRRQDPEALQIKTILQRFAATGMTDHYVLGQLENVDNGMKKLDPDTPAKVELTPSSVRMPRATKG